jgi:hypothetical protein
VRTFTAFVPESEFRALATFINQRRDREACATIGDFFSGVKKKILKKRKKETLTKKRGENTPGKRWDSSDLSS